MGNVASDHEYTATVTAHSEKTMEAVHLDISIDKVGGGVLGYRYIGDWDVYVNGQPFDTLTTGTPKSHHAAAQVAADYFVHYRDYPEGY